MGMSQNHFAREIGVSHRGINEIVHGKRLETNVSVQAV
jgi:plasmid maintenance system antidote protein VapI